MPKVQPPRGDETTIVKADMTNKEAFARKAIPPCFVCECCVTLSWRQFTSK